MRLVLPLLVVLFCLPVALPVAAETLTGSAEWSYAQYQAEEDGHASFDAYHLTQQYSLLYEKEALINSGKAGRYTLGFGYEWNAVDGERGGHETQLRSGKIFYKGALTIAPGGLPFRLDVFSGDNHRTQFLFDSTYASSGLFSMNPLIVDNMQNGQHTETGARLMVGIRNGSYLGAYRDILSKFPKLLMDYREIHVRDLQSLSPQDYRLRHLAFVSLNKKDNWFHYRFSDFKDYINHSGDYVRRSYMLGTVDHLLIRKWINLTNWLKLSADGSFSQDISVGKHDPPRNEYAMNLFGIGHRKNMSASTYTSFSSVVEGDAHTKSLSLPLMYTQVLDRDTSVRGQLWLDNKRVEQIGGSGGSDEYDQALLLSLENYQSRPWKVTSSLELERKAGDEGNGAASRLGVELSTNGKHYRDRNGSLQYKIGLFRGSGRADGDVDFEEHQLEMHGDIRLNHRLVFGVGESLGFGRGVYGGLSFRHVSPQSSLGASQGHAFRSSTTVFADWSVSRVSDRISVGATYSRNGSSTDQNMEIKNVLDLIERNARLTLTNVYTHSSNQTQIDSHQSKGNQFHSLAASYLFSRALSISAKANFSEGDEGRKISANQLGKYSLFTSNGIVRKLLYFEEGVDWEKFDNGENNSQENTVVKFSTFYYPVRKISYGVHGLLSYRTSFKLNQRAFGCSAKFDFQKLQLFITYDYVNTLASLTRLDQYEQRWEMRLKKQF